MFPALNRNTWVGMENSGFVYSRIPSILKSSRFWLARMSQLLAAIITLVVFVIVCTLADYIIADITFVVFVCIDAILRLRAEYDFAGGQ